MKCHFWYDPFRQIPAIHGCGLLSPENLFTKLRFTTLKVVNRQKHVTFHGKRKPESIVDQYSPDRP